MAILSFADDRTETLFAGGAPKRMAASLVDAAHRRLLLLAAADTVQALRAPKSNRLHKLGGNLAGRWAISVDPQWRLTFVWDEGAAGPSDVLLTDYH